MQRILLLSVLMLSLFLVACGQETIEPVAAITVTPGALRPAGEPTAVSNAPAEPTSRPAQEEEIRPTAVPLATFTSTATPVVIEGASVPSPVATMPSTDYPVLPDSTGDTAVDNNASSSGYPAPSTTEQAVTATGGNNNTAVTPPPTATVDPNAVFATEGPTETTAEEVLRVIFEDLRLSFDVEASDIEIEEIVAGSWPDSALGCPEPVMNYLQVVTPGYMVTLGVGDSVYVYHADDALNVLLCEQPDRVGITPSSKENR